LYEEKALEKEVFFDTIGQENITILTDLSYKKVISHL